MILDNRINVLTVAEEDRLRELIEVFVTQFGSQQNNVLAFRNLLTTREITLRIICKLSEWCSAPPSKNEGKQQAIEISKILFDGIIPKLDDYKPEILNDKIVIKI